MQYCLRKCTLIGRVFTRTVPQGFNGVSPPIAPTWSTLVSQNNRSFIVLVSSIIKQRRQLAIDHAVHLCVKYSWKHDTGVANVITGKTLDGLDKKQRISERQARRWMLARVWCDRCSSCTVFRLEHS